PDQRSGPTAEDALGGHRPLPARRHPRLPDAGPAQGPALEPPAVRVPARKEWALLRGLAAARAGAEHDPRAPWPRHLDPARARARVLRGDAAGQGARGRLAGRSEEAGDDL